MCGVGKTQDFPDRSSDIPEASYAANARIDTRVTEIPRTPRSVDVHRRTHLIMPQISRVLAAALESLTHPLSFSEFLAKLDPN